MKQYDAILLDLDNTLYPYQTTHEHAMGSLYQAFTSYCGIEKIAAERAFKKARDFVNCQLHGTASSHNRLLYIQNMCEQLQLNSAKYAMQFYNTYWDTFLEKMALFPQAEEFLQRWLALGKQVCLVTDLTAHIQYRKIANLGLTESIHHIVTSEEVGHEKPHPSMFTTALDKLQLKKTQVVMIGDNVEKDILGARRIGIDAYCFSPTEQQIDHEPTINFNDLIEML